MNVLAIPTLHLSAFVAAYGYWAVFGLILVESLGVPLPGEAVLVVTALFAAHTHKLSLAGVIATAALAAFLGTCGGFLLGQLAGPPLLGRYGSYLGLSPARRRLGRYLFVRHGAKIIFLGRFIAFLRTFAGVLAGTNSMPWRRFILFNAFGALAWASIVGLGAYFFGRLFVHVARPIGLAAVGIGAALLVGAFFYLRAQEAVFQKRADAFLGTDP